MTTMTHETEITADDKVPVIRITREFDALADGRTRLTVTSLAGSFEVRAAILAGGMDHGVRDGHEKLDELLRKECY